MKKSINFNALAMYIAATLFFISSLKVPKMVLTYLGVKGNITLMAVGIFIVLDAILALAVVLKIFKLI